MQIRVLVFVLSFAGTTVAAQPPKGAPPTPPVRVPVPATAGVSTPGPDRSKLPKAPKVPATFDALFAERDGRAVDAIGYLRCMQGTVNALRGGALGNVPREWSITCIEQAGEWRGVFGTLNDKGITVQLQVAFRGERVQITRDRVDTARVSGTARALLRGLSAPAPGKGQYEIIPVALAQPTFVEVWFLPVPSDPTKAIVGGDSLIQMSSDGVRELGHGRTTPPIRKVAVPLDAKSWTLQSLEERIPAVSELMIARMALDLMPEVRVRTNQYESVLTRGAKAWTHRPRS